MIARQSKGRASENRKHAKLRAVFLDANPICFRCGCYTKRHLRTLHHYFGRIHELLNFVPGFRMADRECHHYIEHHRKEAIEKGWRADERLFNRPSLVIPQ